MLFSHSRKGIILLLAAGLLITSGCAGKSKYGDQTTKVHHYPDCYKPISDLRATERTVEKNTVGGAAIGGLLGAITGYLATGKASGAAVGAAAGATAGGIAGYYKGKSEMAEDNATRMAEYATMLDGNIAGLNRVTAASKVARECYDRQFTVAVSEFKAGNLTKEQFRSRFTEIRDGMDEASRIIGQVSQESQRAASLYRQTVNEEAQRMGVPTELVSKKATTQTAASSQKKAAQAKLNTNEGQKLTAMAQKTGTMEDSVADLKAEEKLLNERLAAMQRQSDDLMSTV